MFVDCWLFVVGYFVVRSLYVVASCFLRVICSLLFVVGCVLLFVVGCVLCLVVCCLVFVFGVVFIVVCCFGWLQCVFSLCVARRVSCCVVLGVWCCLVAVSCCLLVGAWCVCFLLLGMCVRRCVNCSVCFC